MSSIVIPLGSGSRHNNRELVYALRSFEKFLNGITNVVIVGECPAFLHNIIHIPLNDSSHKQANIRSKILAACADERVTDNFCFLNDDVFLLQPLDINNIPYWHYGDLSAYSEKGRQELIEELKWRNLPTKRFDLHQPIIYNKAKFIEAVSGFNDKCILKSLYCNYWKIEGEEMIDMKVKHPHSYEWIKQNIPGRIFFSVGENAETNTSGFNPSMIRFLEEMFPNKSKYEL